MRRIYYLEQNFKNMKLKATLILLMAVFYQFSLNAQQNYVYKGNEKFIATPTFNFVLNSDYWGSNLLGVTIAKTLTGGYLMLEKETPFEHNYIGGTVTIFLADGTMITCTDKKMKDHVDDKSITLYLFTEAEMERLKTVNISRIRFSIYDQIGDKSEGKNLTADNKKMFSQYGEPQTYNTESEVSKLYK